MAGYSKPWRVSEEKILREQLPDILAGRCSIEGAIIRVRGRVNRSWDGIKSRFDLLLRDARRAAKLKPAVTGKLFDESIPCRGGSVPFVRAERVDEMVTTLPEEL